MSTVSLKLIKSLLPPCGRVQIFQMSIYQSDARTRVTLPMPLPPSLLLAVKPCKRSRRAPAERGGGVSVKFPVLASQVAAMVQTCSAYGCKNRYHKEKDISFHKYVIENYVCVSYLALAEQTWLISTTMCSR